jgi:hypothetical protein
MHSQATVEGTAYGIARPQFPNRIAPSQDRSDVFCTEGSIVPHGRTDVPVAQEAADNREWHALQEIVHGERVPAVVRFQAGNPHRKSRRGFELALRADDGTRTRNLQLGKLTLYH